MNEDKSGWKTYRGEVIIRPSDFARYVQRRGTPPYEALEKAMEKMHSEVRFIDFETIVEFLGLKPNKELPIEVEAFVIAPLWLGIVFKLAKVSEKAWNKTQPLFRKAFTRYLAECVKAMTEEDEGDA